MNSDFQRDYRRYLNARNQRKSGALMATDEGSADSETIAGAGTATSCTCICFVSAAADDGPELS